MKRINLITAFILICSCITHAGGILTNTNQSAMFTRMQSRDATLGTDAVYFNPAGIGTFSDGFYFSLNNQTLGQTRIIRSDYDYLNIDEYEGEVSAPLFPGIYAAWKKGKFGLSAGFNPIGGGGGGQYHDGLPSFEYSISDLVPALNAQGQDIQGYRMNAYFEGTSVYFGYQANISYQINEMMSVSIGGRYVTAKETYNGYLRNVQVNTGGSWVTAVDFFNGIVTQATAGAESATTASMSIQPLIDNGAGQLTFEQAVNASIIDASTQAQLEGGLQALGIDPTGMTIAEAQAAYTTAASDLTQTALESGVKSQLLADQEAETEKTATGFTPIVSVNITPSEKLNIALKYEHQTKLEFENNTADDFVTGIDPSTGTEITMFPDGHKSRLDLPSQIAAGVAFRPLNKLLISAGAHYYLDQQADWNGREELLDRNSYELAIGSEYNLTQNLLVSGGYLYTKSGASKLYQTDLSYSLPSNTIGFGAAYQLNNMLELNLGASYTMYQEGEGNKEHDFAGTGSMIPVIETYDKDVWIIGVGLNIEIGR